MLLEMLKNISWTDRVKNENALRRAEEERNILPTIKGSYLNQFVSYCVGTAF
jgi:hypothetical protein